MTSAGTHEEVERRLLRGLELTLPSPSVVVRYSTTAPCDLYAAWLGTAPGYTLFTLHVEVKTTSLRGRWPRVRDPLELAFGRRIEAFSQKQPAAMYAVFDFRRTGRGKTETRVRSTHALARATLGVAWAAAADGDGPV